MPDNGDSGGSYQSPVALDKALGRKAASIGLYAHLREDIPFDCVELTDIGGSLTAVYSGLGTDPKTPSEIKDYKKDALLEAVVKAGGVVRLDPSDSVGIVFQLTHICFLMCKSLLRQPCHSM